MTYEVGKSQAAHAAPTEALSGGVTSSDMTPGKGQASGETHIPANDANVRPGRLQLQAHGYGGSTSSL